ncbi:hypothetical protein ADL01_16285 [Streptomyces sp. NRRL WC-3618]|nr:hypothetical protein ADL01_16285 [Streptomyces sp. NRRL WC-3618]
MGLSGWSWPDQAATTAAWGAGVAQDAFGEGAGGGVGGVADDLDDVFRDRLGAVAGSQLLGGRPDVGDGGRGG